MPSRPRPGGETGRTTPPWSGPARVEEAAGRAGNTKQCPPSHPRDLQAQTSSDVAPPEEQGGNGAERSWSRVPKVTALCGRTIRISCRGRRQDLHAARIQDGGPGQLHPFVSPPSPTSATLPATRKQTLLPTCPKLVQQDVPGKS